jgi:hypothetical protein
MLIIHPLAAHTDKVADFQHNSMEHYISKAYTEGIHCVLYTLRWIPHCQKYIDGIPDIFSTSDVVSYRHDACRRDMREFQNVRFFKKQVVEISDFLKTSSVNIKFSYHVGENYTRRTK